MGYPSKSLSLNKILILVFGVAFGLVALAMVFQGAKTGSDIRSRAAATERLVQGWEFNGKTTENWIGLTGTTLSIQPIALPNRALVAIGSTVQLQNNTIKTIPAGFKQVKMRLAVMAKPLPQPRTVGEKSQLSKQKPISNPMPPQINSTFKATIVISGKKSVDSYTGTFNGPVDGQYHEYAVALPQTLPVNAGSLQIVIGGSGASILTTWFDWIHVVITNPSEPTPTPTLKPTPTPPPGCNYLSKCNVGGSPSSCTTILVCPTPKPTPACVSPLTCSVKMVIGGDGYLHCPVLDLGPGRIECKIRPTPTPYPTANTTGPIPTYVPYSTPTSTPTPTPTPTP